ncbi:MAG TPA: uL15m family ribosomal protein [Candidatus Nanoarchaeia archaeon]|nr:uL15m family ribosomal protein [Candidatus Nanoarchaeia archaeon]
MKLKKRRKSSRWHGSQTHGRGAKERTRGSGNQGGKGMAGTGKRADHKKSLVFKLYGPDYFGKDKTLRRGAPQPKLKIINLGDVEQRQTKLIDDKGIINLDGYKILGSGDLKTKLKIKASAASQSAIEKAKASGSEISIPRPSSAQPRSQKKNDAP